MHLECGQSVADGAERRHECCGDRDTGDYITLVLACDGEYACPAAKEPDEHVVDCGGGACEQFAVPRAYR